ncbi:hypothetical protein OG876_01370 [Kribbella sp. NBC_00359]
MMPRVDCASSSAAISAGDANANFGVPSNSATAPTKYDAAIDVPLAGMGSGSIFFGSKWCPIPPIEMTLAPGAKMSTQPPQLEPF